jgi:hypothetical protein
VAGSQVLLKRAVRKPEDAATFASTAVFEQAGPVFDILDDPIFGDFTSPIWRLDLMF